MKFYQAEMEAIEFMNGYHTLTEWARFGFNKVVLDGVAYYDGLKEGVGKFEETGELYDWESKDWDEDGYMYLTLRKVKKGAE